MSLIFLTPKESYTTKRLEVHHNQCVKKYRYQLLSLRFILDTFIEKLAAIPSQRTKEEMIAGENVKMISE